MAMMPLHLQKQGNSFLCTWSIFLSFHFLGKQTHPLHLIPFNNVAPVFYNLNQCLPYSSFLGLFFFGGFIFLFPIIINGASLLASYYNKIFSMLFILKSLTIKCHHCQSDFSWLLSIVDMVKQECGCCILLFNQELHFLFFLLISCIV